MSERPVVRDYRGRSFPNPRRGGFQFSSGDFRMLHSIDPGTHSHRISAHSSTYPLIIRARGLSSLCDQVHVDI